MLSDRFCQMPFSFAEIHQGGDVFFCCPTWTGFRSIGNVFRDSSADLWNSLEAQEIRTGILDGSFRGCDCAVCPEIVSGNLPRRTKEHDAYAPTLSKGPKKVKLCHDDTCNLSCPSCRTHMIVANRERQAELDRMLNEFIVPFLADTSTLWLSGDGDPFASKHYRDILRATAQSNPGMRINLHTNAVLCDERAWDDCSLHGRVDEVDVSIDAARPETYAIVRRGGNFERLLKNLEFLGRLRQDGMIKRFEIAFVVQERNFREMPEFVKLGQRLHVDCVGFSVIQHWSRAMDDEEFAMAQVSRPDHPQYREFLSVLDDPILSEPIVYLGNVSAASRAS
jgi:pyruvate-formate lyase-activating enzyme